MARWCVSTALLLTALVACQNPFPTTAPQKDASTHSLTVSWRLEATSSHTLLPSYPTPSTYDVLLHPTSGSDLSQSGLSGSSWTFTNLSPVLYTITVSGKDGGGNLIVSGNGSADLSSVGTQNASISLHYISSGTGTGTIHLSFDASGASGISISSTSFTLVDPSGTIIQNAATLSGSSPIFSYANSAAVVGSYKMFASFTDATNGKQAMKVETILVVQNVDTSLSIPLATGDFTAIYAAVSDLSLSSHTLTLTLGGATGSLSATLSPSNASNILVSWSTSAPSVAGVDQSGTVTAVGVGTASSVTITATSVDNPLAQDSCTVTVKGTVTYNSNGGTAGSVPVDSNTYTLGQTVVVAGNTGNLVRTGYVYNGWNTAANGSGTPYSGGQTFGMPSANVALYAQWLPQYQLTVVAGTGGTITTPSSSPVTVTYGSLTSIVAMPDAAHTFGNWSVVSGGGVSFGNASSASTTVTLTGGAVTIRANFTPISGAAQWAQAVTTGSNWSYFNSVATDASGNVYAAGYIFGTGSYGFGNGVTATGTYNGYNMVLVKYNSSGTAQWAQTAISGSDNSRFDSVATDASGNVFAAGYIYGTGSFGFGNGITAAGTYSSLYNVVLVKYNSSGFAQWAQTVTSGSFRSWFRSVALDVSGNVYAAGQIEGTGSFGFGNGVTAAGTANNNNIVLVKYNSSGTAQWAQTATSGIYSTYFRSVVTDAIGNVYAAGIIDGTGGCGFGNGVAAEGKYITDNVVLVKYNSSGAAQWAQTVTSGSFNSLFFSVAIDTSGNVYAAGYIDRTGSFGFGNSVTAAGTYNGYNAVLVKYNSSGTAQWAQTVTSGLDNSHFNSVATDASGNVYAVGYIWGTGSYGFGNGVTAAGTNSSDHNVVLVKYNSSGIAQWAKTATSGANQSVYNSVTTDVSGNVYAAGYIMGTGSYGFGNGVTAAGVYNSYYNVVLVKYFQ
jgi:uncharacterized repeat protein (TIGR02543 family)